MIVPHARDERRFDPGALRPGRDAAAARRRAVRPPAAVRWHAACAQGLVEVLEALDRLGDDRYQLALFGTGELDELRSRARQLERWVLPLPYQRFDELPPLVGAADLACVLQDPDAPGRALPDAGEDHRRARHGCAVPGDGHAAAAAADRRGRAPGARPAEPLHERIASIFDDYDDALDRAREGPRAVPREYSYEAVSRARRAAVRAARRRIPPVLPNDVARSLKAPRSLLAARTRTKDRVDDDPGVPARVPGSRRWRAAPDEQYDVVMFWKQNDTSIYGRRQDMFLKYLAALGSVRHDRALRQPDHARDPRPHVPGERRTGGPAPAGRAPDAAAAWPIAATRTT